MTGSDNIRINVFIDFWRKELQALGRIKSIIYSISPAPCLLVTSLGAASNKLCTKVSEAPLKPFTSKLIAKHVFYNTARHKQLFIIWLSNPLDGIQPFAIQGKACRHLMEGFGLRLSKMWREHKYPSKYVAPDPLGLKNGLTRLSRGLYNDLKINFPLIAKIVVNQPKANLQISFVATKIATLRRDQQLIVDCARRAGFDIPEEPKVSFKTYHVNASQSREGVKHVARVKHTIIHIMLNPKEDGATSILRVPLPKRRGFNLCSDFSIVL